MGVLTVGRIKVCIWCPQSLWCVYSFYRSVAKISFVMAFYTSPGKALPFSFHCLKYRTIYFWHLLFVLNTVLCITRVSIHKASSERAISSPCSDSTKPPEVVTVWLGLLLCFITRRCEHSSASAVVILAVTWVSTSPWQLPPPPFSPGFQTPADPIAGGSEETKERGGQWEENGEQGAQVETDTQSTQVISSTGVEWARTSSELRLHLTFSAYNTRLIFLKEKRKFLF